jgi:hypothetical protein
MWPFRYGKICSSLKFVYYFGAIMNIKLQLLANNNEKTWTLKPIRDSYSVGTIPGCDVVLTGLSVDVNLKFSYDKYSSVWYVSDLSKRGNLLINAQPLSDYQIDAQCAITVERGITINVIPEGSPASVNVQSSRGNKTTAIYETSAPSVNQTFQQASNNQHRASSQGNNSKLRKLTWAQYVDECVKNQGATRFSLITGCRYTPWVKEPGSIGFNAFDGYILPDFKDNAGRDKSSDTVMLAVQNKLSEMQPEEMKYDNTHCCVASLTDAHIVNSVTQSFLGIELFPIKRGRKFRSDYRDFCVVSYNRVTAYLLVENYGSDLFVSWITRFEPQMSEAYLMIIILVSVLIGLAISAVLQNGLLLLSTMIMPVTIYLLMPQFMLQTGIVPKAANARFLGICASIIGLLFLSILAGANGGNSSYGIQGSTVSFTFFFSGFILLGFFQLVSFFIDKFSPTDIPPLDLIDAKKLDDAVSKQVESVLKPMLEQAHYTSDQISQILTRTSLGRTQFRR